MTGPANSTTNAFGSRFYNWKDEKFASVTTIIGGGVPKPALVNWAAKLTAEYAVNNLHILQSLDKVAAVDLVKAAHRRAATEAADVGSAIHGYVESVILGTPEPGYPKECEASMAQYADFLLKVEPAYEASEATVYSRQYGYAGTLDAIAVIRGNRWLIDVKTGKGVYAEAALQMAAYRYADFIAMPDGTEAPIPEVDGCAVLHIRPEFWSFVPLDSSEETFAYFLDAKRIHQWANVKSKLVVAPALYTSEQPVLPMFEPRIVK